MIFHSPMCIFFPSAHRSHRRCLITESMMKTNCCVYRNVLRSAVPLPLARVGEHRKCCENSSKLCDVKIHQHRYKLSYDHILSPFHDFCCWCVRRQKSKKWSMDSCLSLLPTLPCAYSKRNSVSSFTVHPWISDFNKEQKKYIYISLLSRLRSFAMWYRFGLNYWREFVFWYILAFLLLHGDGVFWFRSLFLRCCRKYQITCFGVDFW